MKLDVPNYYLYFVPDVIHVEFKNENCIFRICNGSFRIMRKNIVSVAAKYNLDANFLLKYVEALEKTLLRLRTEEKIEDYTKCFVNELQWKKVDKFKNVI